MNESKESQHAKNDPSDEPQEISNELQKIIACQKRFSADAHLFNSEFSGDYQLKRPSEYLSKVHHALASNIIWNYFVIYAQSQDCYYKKMQIQQEN